MRQFPRRQDLFSRNRWWEAGRISGDEGISRQLIGIANRCGVFADQFCSSGYFTAKKDFYGNAVIRPLRTATRRSWQPGGFGDSCLPDGISWRAGLPIRGGDADAGCGLAVDVVTACRKNPLPTPLALGIRIIALWHGGAPRRPFPWQDPVRAGL